MFQRLLSWLDQTVGGFKRQSRGGNEEGSQGSNGAAVKIRGGEDEGPEALASLGLMTLSKVFKQPLWERRGKGGGRMRVVNLSEKYSSWKKCCGEAGELY